MNKKMFAAKLGIGLTTLRKCLAAGMPGDSLPAARQWRRDNLNPVKSKEGRRDGNPGGAAPAADNAALLAEKVLSERAGRRLRELDLAQRQGRLVDVAQLEAGLQQAFSAFRTELLARDDKLAEAIQQRYKIAVDPELLNEHTYRALSHLSAYSPAHGFQEEPQSDELG